MNEEALLVEEVTTAHRPDRPKAVRSHPSWHDLSDEARIEVFEETRRLRMMEAAIDPEGLSTTARAVLERIRRA